MKHYSIVELDITDGSWIEEYVGPVTRMIEERGGRFLARTTNVDVVEGEARGFVVLIQEWPNREDLDAFYDSEDYRPYREMRQAGGRTHLRVLPGEDVTGARTIEP